MRPIVFALQFRGRAGPVPGSDKERRARSTAPSQRLTTVLEPDGIRTRVDALAGDTATLDSRVERFGDGTFVEEDSVIIISDPAHPDAAKQLIDTILAKDTQEELLAQSYRRPSRSDIDVSQFVDFPKLEDLTIVDIHGDQDTQGRADFLELWKSAS